MLYFYMCVVCLLEYEGRPWSHYEAYEIIILHQVEALIKLGAQPRLKVTNYKLLSSANLVCLSVQYLSICTILVYLYNTSFIYHTRGNVGQWVASLTCNVEVVASSVISQSN